MRGECLTSRQGYKLGVKYNEGFDTFDYVLLTLLACLGLVWARMFFMFAVVTAPCAEHIASFGYVASGWLAGHTVWSLLYGISGLALLFSVLVALLYTHPGRPVITVFRIAMVCGFLLMTLMFRGLVIDNPMPVDGVVKVNPSSDAFNQWSIIREAALDFEGFDEVLFMGRSACVFIRRQVLVVSDRFLIEGPQDESLTVLSALEKGIFIKRLQSSQAYLDISDEDLPVIIDRMKPTLLNVSWDDN